MVVLPSPAGVGDMAVTKINLPFSFFDKELTAFVDNLALSFPYLIRSSESISNKSAISSIGFLRAALAISKSVE